MEVISSKAENERVINYKSFISNIATKKFKSQQTF
jgi:hypothetical protein